MSELRIIDPGPIPFADVPNQQDQSLRFWIVRARSDNSKLAVTAMTDDVDELTTACFRLVELDLKVLDGQYSSSIDDFRHDDDRDRANRLLARYRAGLEVDPVVIGTIRNELAVFDGCHRLTAMHTVGLRRVVAFQLLD